MIANVMTNTLSEQSPALCGANQRYARPSSVSAPAKHAKVQPMSAASHGVVSLEAQFSDQTYAKSSRMIICTTRKTPDARRATQAAARGVRRSAAQKRRDSRTVG